MGIRKTFNDPGSFEQEVIPNNSVKLNYRKKPVSSKPLLLNATTPWYSVTFSKEAASEICKETPKKGIHWRPATSTEIALLREKGKELLESQTEQYSISPVISKSDLEWYETVLNGKGTFRDKISAYSLLIASTPVYTMEYLRSFMTLLMKNFQRKEKENNFEGEGSGLRKEYLMNALEALVNLFISNILPDRKLILLEQREYPFVTGKSRDTQNPIKLSDEILLLYYIEDSFKRAYIELLNLLKLLLHDPLFYVKNRTLNMLVSCMATKPEQEQLILQWIVDKMGDPEKKLSSKVGYLLSQLLIQHPNMMGIIVEEVWKSVLSAPLMVKLKDGKISVEGVSQGYSLNAKYYSLLFLTQCPLSSKQDVIANRLVSIYLSFFEMLLTYEGKWKMIGNEEENDIGNGNENDILQGDNKVEGPVSTALLLKQSRKFVKKYLKEDATSKSADSSYKKQQVVKRNEKEMEQAILTDKKHKEQLDKLYAAVLTGLHRAIPYSHLSADALDQELKVLYAFVHPSQSSSASLNPNKKQVNDIGLSVQALWLLYRLLIAPSANNDGSNIIDTQAVASLNEANKNHFYRVLYESLLDSRFLIASNKTLHQYFMLLSKALLFPPSSSTTSAPWVRLAAFIKRLLQASVLHEPSFICASFMLIIACIRQYPVLFTLWIHNNNNKEVPSLTSNPTSPPASYDIRKREPLYANADKSALWELFPFLNHYHPSVKKLANDVLDIFQKIETVAENWNQKSLQDEDFNLDSIDLGVDSKKRNRKAKRKSPSHSVDDLFMKELEKLLGISKNKKNEELEDIYKSTNPFESYSLTSFLDRFIYKKPKKVSVDSTNTPSTSNKRPASVFEAKRALTSSVNESSAPSASSMNPVSSKEFLDLKPEQLLPHEAFFHEYFTQRQLNQISEEESRSLRYQSQILRNASLKKLKAKRGKGFKLQRESLFEEDEMKALDEIDWDTASEEEEEYFFDTNDDLNEEIVVATGDNDEDSGLLEGQHVDIFGEKKKKGKFDDERMVEFHSDDDVSGKSEQETDGENDEESEEDGDEDLDSQGSDLEDLSFDENEVMEDLSDWSDMDVVEEFSGDEDIH